jgi:Tol biopolymer transport system component
MSVGRWLAIESEPSVRHAGVIAVGRSKKMLRRSTSPCAIPGFILLPCALAACGTNSAARNAIDMPPEGTGGGSTINANPLNDGGSISPVGVDGSTGVSTQSVTLRAPWPDATGPSWKEQAVAANPASMFASSPSSSPKPTWGYPLEGSMHPRNLVNISFLWRKANSTDDLFRIVVQGPDAKTYYLYFSCGGGLTGCQKPPLISASGKPDIPDAEWFDLGKKYAGQQVTLIVQETTSTGGAVYQSDPLHVYFSPDEVLGTLYYWAAADWSIKRATFGAREAVRFIEGRPSPTNTFSCQACHSVSRDGTAIAFAVCEKDGENTAAIQSASTLDPENPWVRPAGPAATPYTDPKLTHAGDPAYTAPVTQGPTNNFGQNVALSPDGKFAAVNGVGDPPNGSTWRMEMRDTHTGANVQTVLFQGGVNGPIHPEWSPDGKYLLASWTDNNPTTCSWTYSTCSGGIRVSAVDPATGQTVGGWGPVTTPASGHFHYYPTWSPDMKYVAFVDAVCPGGPGTCKSDTVNNGVLYMVSTQNMPHTCPGDCIELARGGQFSSTQQAQTMGQTTIPGPGIHSTLPKFTPYTQGPNGSVMFIAFTSKMPYGTTPSPGNQLWMFAIDVTKSGDPSYAPIWLPYQRPTDGSLAPFWAATAPCQSAAGGGCSGCRLGETCLVDEQNNTCTCFGGQVN